MSDTQRVQLHDLFFEPLLDAATIQRQVENIAAAISQDYHDRKPLLLAVLNGAFVFAADLLRAMSIEAEISFVKLSSYHGTESTGRVRQLIGLDQELHGRHVIVVEDIVDSGETMHQFLPDLRARGCASVALASLLVKPDSLKKEVPFDYIGFEIPSEFVVGYGLDYNELGRGLSGIYTRSNVES